MLAVVAGVAANMLVAFAVLVLCPFADEEEEDDGDEDDGE